MVWREGSGVGQRWRAVAVIQVRDAGGLDQGGGRGCDKKQ